MSDKAKAPFYIGTQRIQGEIIANSLHDLNEDDPDGDKRFSCRLISADRVLFGSRGAMLFPKEELKKAVGTGIHGAVNSDHNYEALNQFGQIIDNHWEDEGESGFLAADATLFTSAMQSARDAHYLMKTQTVRFTSAEIFWEEATCSICGNTRTFGDPDGACVHVKKFNGRMLQGKRVYEIARGLTLDGMAITRFPADHKAEISYVASADESNQPTEETMMDEETKTHAGEGDGTNVDDKPETKPIEDTKPDTQKAPEADKAELSEGEGEVNAEEQKADDEAKPAAHAEGDGNDPDDKQDPPSQHDDGMTEDQLRASVEELSSKLKLAHTENEMLKKHIGSQEGLIQELKWELRRIEVQAFIETLKAKGKKFTENEEYEAYWRYMKMSDTEFAGVKAAIQELSGNDLPQALKNVKRPTSLSTPPTESPTIPAAVPDNLNVTEGDDIERDFQNLGGSGR